MSLMPSAAAGIAVTHVRKFWNPKSNKGKIEVLLSNGQNLTVPLDHPQEYVVVALTLQEPNLALLPDGTLVGWR